MDFPESIRYLQVALGIGLVIFVHEGGHFIAARLCKVRVETFSLGFGPRIFGWKRGPTTYQIALVPLGGYVKMAGEEVGERAPPAPDDLRSKTVGQRFFIYSGGVLMNLLFGLLIFPIVLAVGVPFSQPLIGDVLPGGPAWQAHIAPGTTVLEVEGESTFSFDSILNEIALSTGDEVLVTILGPGASEPRELTLRPIYSQEQGLRTIEVGPALDPERHLLVEPDSPAARAGLQSDDRLVGLDGALPEEDLVRQVIERMGRGESLALEVDRGGVKKQVEVQPVPSEPKGGAMLGVAPAAQRVRDIRGRPRAEDDASEPTAPPAGPTTIGIQVEDRIVAVNQTIIVSVGDFKRAVLEAAGAPFTMYLLRAGREVALEVPALDRASAFQLVEDVALVRDEDSTTVAVQPESSAARAGVRDGDRLVRIGDTPVSDWKEVLEATKRQAKKGEALQLTVLRRSFEALGATGTPERFDLVAHPAPRSDPRYGFDFVPAMHIYKAHGPAQALKIGFKSAWKFLRDGWNTLKGIVIGNVGGENIGGIITIGKVSYSWAEVGLAKLFFFLCMLSINLAFLNVLPIPVLDGGHLFFLLVEKVKGSPVSERVLGYSQMVGLVLIVSLMIYVTYNDIRRWWLP